MSRQNSKPTNIVCRKLSNDWEASNQLSKHPESFTCLMYGDNKTQSLDFL